MSTYFFIIFVTTIVVTRLFVYVYTIPSPTIGKFRTHHWMFGILGILLGLGINSLAIYAIGWGLFIDKLTYLLMRGKTHEDNYSKISLIGTFLFALFVLVFTAFCMKIQHTEILYCL